MRLLAIAAILLTVTTAPATGAPIELAWSACAGDGGYTDLEFPCGCSSLPVPLIGTFTSSRDLPNFVSIDFTINIYASADTLPDFWTFNTPLSPEACNGGIELHGLRPPTGCESYASAWAPSAEPMAAMSFSQDPSYMPPNRGRIVGSVYRDGFGTTTLSGGVPTFAFQIDLYPDAATESGGSCAGCGTHVDISLSRVTLWSNSESGFDSEDIVEPAFVTSEPGGRAISCLPTPARRTTWGVLKSLYR